MKVREEKLLNKKEHSKYKRYYRVETENFIHHFHHLDMTLPIDVCFDDDQYYIQHDHPLWIYFNNSYDYNNQHWVPLIVSNDNCYIPLPYTVKLNITYTDYEYIRTFVMLCAQFIKHLAHGMLQFEVFMHIVRQLMNPLNATNCVYNKPYMLYNDAGYGFSIVKNNDGLFNYIKDNKLIGDIWFDFVDIFIAYNDSCRAYVRSQNKHMFIYPDGHTENIN